MTKQTLKNAALSATLFGLALSSATSLSQVGRTSKLAPARRASAAVDPASHPAKTPGTPSYAYTVLAYPGSLSTSASGINHGATASKSEIVGVAGSQGFLVSVSEKKSTTEKYQALNYPHVATFVNPIDINNLGQIVGVYVDSSNVSHGFERSNGKFLPIAVTFAGATDTIPFAINESGEIVGGWTDNSGVIHGFTLIGGNYVSFDYPGATDTQADDVNNSGEIVGIYYDTSNVEHGFLLSGGTFTSIDYPGAASTATTAINDSGTIAGATCPTTECFTTGDGEQGFVLSAGVFAPVAIPGEVGTYVNDITNNGMLVGAYIDAAGLIVSFLAIP